MNWQALLSTLGLILIAELGDKTQLAVVTQTCKYRRPWPVFVGASLALTLVTLLGAVGGRVLGSVLPAALLQTIAAIAFVVMGLFIAREASQRDGETCDPICEFEDGGSPAISKQAFATTFGLLFVAELGDKTQLAVLSLSSQYQATWPVFVGGAIALTIVTGIGVIGGQGLCRIIPERVLLWISATAFVIMGVLMLFGVI